MLLMVPLLMSYVIKIYAIRSILGLNGFLNKALMAVGSDQRALDHVRLQPERRAVEPDAAAHSLRHPADLSVARAHPAHLLQCLRRSRRHAACRRFLRITLPLSLPGVASAASFVFVLSIGDFLTPQMVGGVSGFTFGRILYSQFGTAFNWPFGAALSVALAAVVIVAILLGERLGRSRGISA